MDAASMEEGSSDRSIVQPASPDEQQDERKDIQGGCPEVPLSMLTVALNCLSVPLMTVSVNIVRDA